MLAVVGFQQLVDRYDRTVTKEELLDPDARREPSTDLDGPLNYLLVGSDGRRRQQRTTTSAPTPSSSCTYRPGWTGRT